MTQDHRPEHTEHDPNARSAGTPRLEDVENAMISVATGHRRPGARPVPADAAPADPDPDPGGADDIDTLEQSADRLVDEVRNLDPGVCRDADGPGAASPPRPGLSVRPGPVPKLSVSRRFTADTHNPFDGIDWQDRTVANPADPDDRRTITAPAGWSDTAVTILAFKYARRSDPDDPAARETDLRQIAARLTNAWSAALRDAFAGPEDRAAFRDELAYMLVHQMAAPNSPQWFNTGLHEAYGLDDRQRLHYYTDHDGIIRETRHTHRYPMASACFILDPQDTLTDPSGIMETWRDEARIFSGGAGAGANFSRIRGAGEPLSNGGQSSGLGSFLRIGDTAAGTIKSGGGTRRAAKMIVVDDDHPDLLEIVDWKMLEEAKVAMLVTGHDVLAARLAAGDTDGVPAQITERHRHGTALPPMSYDWRADAYRTVSGQNANISVRVSDAFMTAAGRAGATWPLTRRTDGSVAADHPASELLDRIAYAAWASADPGVQFHDTINGWNTAAATHTLRATNPCSEYVHIDNSACNLASLNLHAFAGADGALDLDALRHAAELWTAALEATVALSGYPTAAIAENVRDHRALGLGFANLGGHLLANGIPYDSDAARSAGAGIAALIQAAAWNASCILAETLGPCAAAAPNAAPLRRVFDRHAAAALSVDHPAARAADAVWQAIPHPERVRNMQLTAVAPTGTIGLVMDCATTGIEPEFALVRHKSLAGGGTITILNPLLDRALADLGYSDTDRGAIRDAAAGGQPVTPLLAEPGHAAVLACATPFPGEPSSTAISPAAHLHMLAAVQPHVSGAISKTVNLPGDATPADVRNLITEAWTLGVKCLSVYRDGSKLSQPLTAAGAGDRTARSNAAIAAPAGAPQRRKMPWKRDTKTYSVSIGGHKLVLQVSEFPDEAMPGEIFLQAHREGSDVRTLMNILSMAVSIGFQYGVPPETYVRLFRGIRCEPAGIVRGDPDIRSATSMPDYVFHRIQIDYLPETLDPSERPGTGDAAATGTATAADTRPAPAAPVLAAPAVTGDLCHLCGGLDLVRSGTCLTCRTCGATTGCS